MGPRAPFMPPSALALIVISLFAFSCDGGPGSPLETNPSPLGSPLPEATSSPSASPSALPSPTPSPDPRIALEAAIDGALSTAQASASPGFSYLIERVADGRSHAFDWGGSTAQTLYESASTSKLVTAVIILRLVQDNYLSLDDHPQTWLSSAVWPMPSGDPLSGITLSHLLSFTSGLKIEPDATASPAPSPAPPYFVTGSEVLAIANLNMGKTTLPGSEFYYNSNHLQVAGLMAIKARDTADAVDFTSWKNVFDEFKAQTGLFTSSAYDLPPLTPSNPRLAGGMHWTASDYMAFLRALAKGQLLNSAMMAQLLADYTPAASVTIGYSPLIVSSLNEDWHYGYGLWQEYQGNPYAGTAGSRVSCPGAYGAYPFWDISHGYFGIVARQGPLGTFPEGVIIERSARTLEEQWAALP